MFYWIFSNIKNFSSKIKLLQTLNQWYPQLQLNWWYNYKDWINDKPSNIDKVNYVLLNPLVWFNTKGIGRRWSWPITSKTRRWRRRRGRQRNACSLRRFAPRVWYSVAARTHTTAAALLRRPVQGAAAVAVVRPPSDLGVHRWYAPGLHGTLQPSLNQSGHLRASCCLFAYSLSLSLSLSLTQLSCWLLRTSSCFL